MFERFHAGLDPEVNERACQMVMRNVAMLPQGPDSQYLIADSVLKQDEIDLPPRLKTGIGLLELAQIRPNGRQLMPTLDKIHDSFGITRNNKPLRLPAATIGNFVTMLSYGAINLITDATSHVAKGFEIVAPDHEYPQLPVKGELARKQALGLATEVMTLFKQEPDVRAHVGTLIGEAATQRRPATRQRQAYAASEAHQEVRRQWREPKK